MNQRPKITLTLSFVAYHKFYHSAINNKEKELSTRRTLHADVNTRKGANGELFIDSIPDFVPKSNSFDENFSKMLIRVVKKTIGLNADGFNITSFFWRILR